MSLETVNAIITKATLTSEDHGVLSAWVILSYGGSGQGFGGYPLYLPAHLARAVGQPNYAGHFIWRVMEVAGVTEWSQVVGKSVRVRREHDKAHAIGHIVRDDWFNPSSDFKAMEDAHR